ncbi:MAG: 50S ribosomal protein L24 [Acidobacteriota bacterium]|nr:50S ribosomal protein L24 [Acidobacteriota bacterium]
MKIRKGDDVLVIAGKFRGERAKVEEALPARGLVVLDGLNIAKRHTKLTGSAMQAGIIDKVLPMSASNVALWCNGHKGPAKVALRDADGTKVRVCRKCGEVL